MLKLTALALLALTAQGNTTCCDKGNPPKCYQCYAAAPELKRYVQHRQWRCVVNIAGKVAHTSVHSTYDECYTACVRVVFDRLQRSGGMPISHNCYRD